MTVFSKFLSRDYTVNLVKLFDLESVLAFKVEVIVPSIEKGHLRKKWAGDVSSVVELEAIDDNRYKVEENACHQPVQEWHHHLDHRVIVE